jgi:hypothetical protein
MVEMLICVLLPIAGQTHNRGVFIGFGSQRDVVFLGCVLARAFVSRLA